MALALAECSHETGWGFSFWQVRCAPRKDPALHREHYARYGKNFKVHFLVPHLFHASDLYPVEAWLLQGILPLGQSSITCAA